MGIRVEHRLWDQEGIDLDVTRAAEGGADVVFYKEADSERGDNEGEVKMVTKVIHWSRLGKIGTNYHMNRALCHPSLCSRIEISPPGHEYALVPRRQVIYKR